MPEQLEGVVERVTFHNPENGFCVLRVRAKKTVSTVVGYLPLIHEGERIVASGAWREDAKHGLQFAADSIEARQAVGRAAVEAFLGSGAIRGIGPSTAALMWTHFKERVFDVLDNDPQRLRQLPGIGPKRIQLISESWQAQRSMRELLLLLAESGIGPERAARIQKQYGADAVRVIRENPYRLVREVRGIGFTTADRLALKLGLPADSPDRIRTGIRHALDEAALQGHCGLPLEELTAETARLLSVPPALVTEALAHELEQKHLVRNTIEGIDAIFLPRLFFAERDIADRLRQLASGNPPWPTIDVPRALAWVERKTKLRLAASQRAAIETVIRSKVTVITGGPGVGKTTLVNSVLKILGAKEIDVALAAPTGRAARRLAESTGREAKTIHRLLEIDPESFSFRRNEDEPLECDLLVVDEASMVDVPLMSAITRAVTADAALLLVGDVDQLPAVGPGQVLGDIIRSAAVPTVRLTEVFRQAAESRIIVNAHAINAGHPPDLGRQDAEGSDFFFVATKPERVAERIVRLVAERIPQRFGFDAMRDVQVLAPMRRTVDALNAALQRTLNPLAAAPESPRIERMGTSFHAGDKVMQTINDYDKDVFNGDIGVIRELDAESETAIIDFDGREVAYEADDFDDLVLSYATTIHKSQGSEYPAVVIALTRQHAIMLQRNLLYTAVTRGRKLVVIVGEEEAVRRAVAERNVKKRWTKLGEWLRNAGRLPDV